MSVDFKINDTYAELLKANASFHIRVRGGMAKYDSTEYKLMQKQLLMIEKEMPSSDIIKHAEILFPKVGE